MIKAEIDDELELKFRELATRKFGCGKDALSRAVEEAIYIWVSLNEREQTDFKEDPVEAINGILSDIKADSVELQHKIKYIWASKGLQDVSDRH